MRPSFAALVLSLLACDRVGESLVGGADHRWEQDGDAGRETGIHPRVTAALDAGWPQGAPPSTLGRGFVEVGWTPALDPPFPRAGLDSNDPRSLTGAIAADLDGDGAEEVLVGAVGREWQGTDPHPLPFVRRLRGALEAAPLRLETPGSLPLALLDLDGDGHRDLVDNRPSLSWGAPGAAFERATELLASGPDAAPFEGMALSVIDLDEDGWLDLLVGNHSCCSRCFAVHPFLRVGPRAFAERMDLIDEQVPGGACALVAGPLGDARAVIGVMSLCRESSPSWFRVRGTTEDGAPRFAPFDPTPLDANYRQSDLNRCAGGLACRAPMGGFIGYIDADEHLDLAVSIDPDHALFRGVDGFPLAEVPFQRGITSTPGPETGREMIPWGVAYVDVDQDGRPDAITTHGNDYIPNGSPEYIGPQYTTLHWNAGAMRFADLSSIAHLSGPNGQWRSLFVTDLDRDGDADLLVGGHGFAPLVFRNDVASGNHGFSLALRGTSSNGYGIGATVVVTPEGGGPASRHFMGGHGSPLAVSEPLIFAGLGAATRASVEVRWPSGTVQRVDGVGHGGLRTLEEPSLFTLDPPSRHLPAGGRRGFTLRVTPRDPAGRVRADARVEVVITHGQGTVHESSMHGELRAFVVDAPDSPGSTRLELRVDGVASPIHPRVWWDAAPSP